MASPNPFFWGPGLWRALHAISFTYPVSPGEKIKEEYANFFHSLVHVLPCPACRQHFKQFISSNPVDTRNRDSLIEWVWKAHKNVNDFYSAPTPSLNDVIKAYTHYPNKNPTKMNQQDMKQYLQFEYLQEVIPNTVNPPGKSSHKKEHQLATSNDKTNETLDILLLILAIIIVGLLAYKTYLDLRS